MLIKTNFTNNGVPQGGLSPTIRIINLPGLDIEVSGAAMTENTEIAGSYFYDFTVYKPTGNYDIRCDGGATLSNYDRYTWATNADDLEIGTGITNIINDLDNPAQYMANVTGIDDLSGYIAPMVVDLNDPDQYKAIITGLSLDGEYDAVISGIQAEVDKPDQYKAVITGLATSGIVATIGVDTTAIKTKTDYLPADMSGEIAIVQGLLHSNIYTVPYWDGDNMTGSLVKLYDNEANARTHGAGGLLATFEMTGAYVGGKAQSILMVRIS